MRDMPKLERRVKLECEEELELPLKPVLSADGKTRINPLTHKVRCKGYIEATLLGVYFNDPLEAKIVPRGPGQYDVIVTGPERPGITATVHERKITPMEPPKTVLPGLG